MKLFVAVLLLTALLQCQALSGTVEKQFVSPANTTCTCPGEVLTYTCTVKGGQATIWGGSAFDCAEREIILHHNNFAGGTSGECNDGAILGQSLGVDGTYYTSQLNVIVSNGLNNKVVTCSSDLMMCTIGQSRIKVAVYSDPDNIYLVDAQKEKLIFSWTPIASNNCSGLKYRITSNCGICPTVTNITTAICSEFQLTTNPVVCNFSVSSVVCDLAGDSGSLVSVTLKVPDIPQVKIIPNYSHDSQALEGLFIVTAVNHTEDSFMISGNISGSPTSYITHASNLVSGSSFTSTLNLSSCEKESGSLIKLPSSFCPPSSLSIISVTISAANILGEGPHSNPLLIECTNNFVQVVYKETFSESTISCIFLNQSDTSEKACCITYQLCDQSGSQNDQVCNKDYPYNIQLEVSGRSDQLYCYTVTASNDTYTVKEEGSFSADFNRYDGGNANTTQFDDSNLVIILCSILLPGASVITIIIVITVPKLKRRRKYAHINEDLLEKSLEPYNFSASTLKSHVVGSDCDMREYITKVLKKEFRRGHTYYEFTNEVENILKGQEVLLLQSVEDTEQWFRLDQPEEYTAGSHKLYGEGIARSSFGEQYRVFIQSFGSGARHLPGGSAILYNHSRAQVQPNVLQLVPICSEYFVSDYKVIDSECTVEEFCIQNGLVPNVLIFFTMENLRKRLKDQSSRDIILMNKVSKELFTGPLARQFLRPKKTGKPQLKKEEWEVFVLSNKEEQSLSLKKGSKVLYQDSRYINGKYTVLKVDEDCVRMSKFIETKLNNHKFDDRRAFYEAEKEEDLLYCKKILCPNEELSCKQLELQSYVNYFYKICGVPSNAVKLEDLPQRKIFIQSTSQGSRCLKKGVSLLYLEEYISCNELELQTDPEEVSDADSDAAEIVHYHIDQQTKYHRIFKCC